MSHWRKQIVLSAFKNKTILQWDPDKFLPVKVTKAVPILGRLQKI